MPQPEFGPRTPIVTYDAVGQFKMTHNLRHSEAALSTNHHGQLVVSLIKQGEILAEYVFGSEETMLLKEMLSHTGVDLSQV